MKMWLTLGKVAGKDMERALKELVNGVSACRVCQAPQKTLGVDLHCPDGGKGWQEMA